MHPSLQTARHWLACTLLAFFVLPALLWLGLFLWIHKPFGEFISFLLISTASLTAIISLSFFGAKLPYQLYLLVFCGLFAIGLASFFALMPKNDRAWQDDVNQMLNFEQRGDMIVVQNVRNFAWRTEQNYDPHWTSRSYQLSQLKTADLIISDWGLGNIVHTMVSFGFSDGQYLTFSIEIRKEQGEQYSALAGFFRQYELLIVAGDEKDLIYTRSNVRGEQVYVYPITANANDIQKLFLTYLNTAKSLHNKPRWYNTLFSNCTTVIYQLIETIAPNQLPKDYRILLAGQLPSYLSQHQLLDNKYSPDEWKKLSYANPKVSQMNIGTPSLVFSQAIRNYDENLLIDNASK